ncbi:zinc carboxypeptidase [Flavobacteriaceae bacterium R38]|nr:zinc carboxypeptidase [Flavobacteriaceae bacterium R38]
MKNNTILLLFLIIFKFSFAQQKLDLSYYLPGDVTYNQNIPTPKDVVGHEVGEWHITHDKLVEYMKAIANSSDRVTLENRGTTFEGRPLLLLTITSPKNHQKIEEIRQQHIQLTEKGSNSLNVENMPVVVYQGLSIHGNEPSGSNSGLVLAYYLAAAQGNEIDALLDNTVILLDPSFNPDGLQRFSYWANTNRSEHLNPDNNEREYHEVWPGGRTNHYWFDMNRDWLPVQLPESRARIATFHKWLPNILTDHHEMGTNSTFFFQPGEPDRVHPLTPQMNQELTAEIAGFHVKALNKIGSLYYSGENYDDYYYGKGSTFPDINGSVGILFEQGSSRGHIQESENGTLTFPFTIRNQFTTELSTLEAAKNLRTKLLNYQRSFYNNARSKEAKKKTKAIVFGDEKDAARTFHLAEILKRHKIKVHEVANDFTVAGKNYKKGYSYIVPTNQKNSTLINAMFEKRTTFKDSLFYDISAWTFPLSFNLDYANLNSLSNAGSEVTDLKLRDGSVDKKSTYAYLFEWHEYYTPKALYKILKKGIRAKVGLTPFSVEGKKYDYGSIMIPVQNQKLNSEELHRFLSEVAKESHLNITSVSTGYTQGIDLGSNDFNAVELPKIAMLVGDGVSPYDAGEIWHLLDQRYEMPITKIDVNYFNRVDIDKYNVFILTNVSRIDAGAKKKLQDWVRKGGRLIGYRNSVNWLKNNDFINLEFEGKSLVAKNISFEQRQRFRGAQVTGGAIFEARTDRSHPVNFGYKNNTISLFRNTNIYIKPNNQSYNNPIQYSANPLLSGYISEENNELIKNSVPFQSQRMGRGNVIVFTDNTNFRAFWYGTNKLMMNAIFFGNMM